ncbi:MAG: response regulator transcription factor [Oscillospiraceae bacterium]|nr:response regulator transcription factor [Oscillospiraceae bacterium]
MQNVLIVCRESEARGALSARLRRFGIGVTEAVDIKEALKSIMQLEMSLMIADLALIELPGGEALLSARRDKGIPCILIIGRGEEARVIELGAEDYVTRPFDPGELAARARMRMGCTEQPVRTIIVHGLMLDPLRQTAEVEGRIIRFTPTEYRILELLCSNRGHIFSAGDIYRRIWNEKYITGSNVVAVHIRHIRKKLGDDSKYPKYLRSVWCAGYKVE